MPIVVRISDDCMEATAEISRHEDETIDVDAIQRALSEAGVTHGIDATACEGLAAAVNQAPPHGVSCVVARGTPVVDGEDGTVLSAVEDDRNPVGLPGEFGSIDFHERGSYTPIEKGQLIALIALPTPGSAGRDVHSKEIKPRPGKRAVVHPGPGTRIEAGGTELRATRAGDLRAVGDVMEVLDMIRVSGNLDYAVGSIECEGPVRVEGDVLPGFHIRAGGDVRIGGVVDGAEVSSKGSVTIGQGILRGSCILAQGNIKAGFTREAYIESDGSVAILTEAINSTVVAGGNIAVRTSGRVVGGRMMAQNRIDVGTAGNPKGTPTTLIAGVNAIKELRAARLIAAINKAEAVHARIGRLKDLAGTGQNEILDELLHRHASRKQDIAAQLAELQQNPASLAECRITVREIHPGVHIRIGPSEMTVEEDRHGTTFSYDVESGQLVQV